MSEEIKEQTEQSEEAKKTFSEHFDEHLQEFVNALRDFINSSSVDNATCIAGLAITFYTALLSSGVELDVVKQYLDEMKERYALDLENLVKNMEMKDFPETTTINQNE